MKKIILIFLITSSFLLSIKKETVYAANECTFTFDAVRKDGSIIPGPGPFASDETQSIKYTINLPNTGRYKIWADSGFVRGPYQPKEDYHEIFSNTKTLSGTINNLEQRDNAPWNGGLHKLNLEISRGGQGLNEKWQKYGSGSCDNMTYQIVPGNQGKETTTDCAWNFNPRTNITSSTPISISVTSNNQNVYSPSFNVSNSEKESYSSNASQNGNNINTTLNSLSDGVYTLTLNFYDKDPSFMCPEYSVDPCETAKQLSCSTKFTVCDKDGEGKPCGWLTPTPTPSIDPICSETTRNDSCSGKYYTACPDCQGFTKSQQSSLTIHPLNPICAVIPDSDPSKSKCVNCVDSKHYAWTAIGCIPTDVSAILKDYVFVYGTGLAGGIAFLYFLYGAFLILTSMGSAEKINEGKEIMISAVSGLILIIFSVFLLGIIGVDILRIPGFTK
ncbi:MAG: hypothetical protein UT63_C0012G0003 [Candidatus Gottesmanbacteria bacterium GW2011_GWC2_39_8]|uniref:Uncharacterized protein n=1 Tax=Candidatus Gottesmanbacteria bacterium GW2011_GWC2_39_8 TaxID=1618450 RepID=A0A0G0Q071_9BACT|nr:MAG: hypothetical protein UT63_C0012G0003 [Candidatus Gottesmanbacteria bacterium GW2011_GWC2_39_8]